MDTALRRFLIQRFAVITQRCKPHKCYGIRGIKNLFKSFDEFYHHITIDLGYDNWNDIKDLVVHRTKQHYEPGGIELLTPAEHRVKHSKKE